MLSVSSIGVAIARGSLVGLSGIVGGLLGVDSNALVGDRSFISVRAVLHYLRSISRPLSIV